MEFDQLIFQKIFRFYERKKKADPQLLARTVKLADIKPRLTLLARALSGDAIEITAATREGGWQANIFYLPEKFSLLPTTQDNLAFYIYRVCYLYVQRKLNLNWPPGREADLASSRLQARLSAQEVLPVLFAEFPALEKIYLKAKEQLAILAPQNSNGKQQEPDYTWLYGRWMKYLAPPPAETLQHINELKKRLAEMEVNTELAAKAAEEVETIQVDKKAQQDFVLTHNFEKAETAEEFSGVWRDFDGDDTLKDDQEALSELNLRHTVRVDDPVHSVYRADFAGNTTAAESRETAADSFYLTYPEWNYKNRSYLPDYCKVFPEPVSTKEVDYYQKTIRHNSRVLLNLRKRFAQMDNVLEQVRRQPTGDNFDIDAVTDMYADLQAHHTPDERIYLAQRKRRKDLAMLFLLDLSLSSDSYTAGNRVLDVEKQVVILFGEVLNEHDVRFEIGGFSSKTRNYCSYFAIKPFDMPWQQGRYRVGSVQPAGYTRIGPALRHAGALLKEQEARKKWLILLSDGKPNDYDRYEGKYGIYDVKQALRELNAANINTYAVAIEDQARYYLPQMFGQNHYNILTSPVEMLQTLTKLYERIEKN